MALNLDHLVGYQRGSFNRASFWRNWSLTAQFTVAMPGVLSIFVVDPNTTYGLAIAGFILLIVAILLDRTYQHHRSAGEAARRATLIIDGLNYRPTAEEKDALAGQLSLNSDKAAALNLTDYFATTEAAGPARLLEMIEESAFFTRYLHMRSAWFMGTVFALTLMIVIIIVLSIIPSNATNINMVVARIVIALLVFLLSSGSLASFSGHTAAWSDAKSIQSRARLAKVRGASLNDALLIMADYNSAVEKAPLVVPMVHSLLSGKLNDRWSDYIKARQADATGAKS
jgi:hypothetical protein